MARTAGECAPRKLPEAVEDGDGPSSCPRELHVLAVDDSLVDRKVIERLLKISSCRGSSRNPRSFLSITAVESGRRALQYLGLDGEKSSVGFDGLKVNLIITDYSMPGMTGYELLKKIKESSTLREIPVVIMSSENVLARIDRCLEEGAEEFLLKPVKLSDVKRLTNFILRGQAEENGGKRKLQDEYVPPPLSQPASSSLSSLDSDESSTSILCPSPTSIPPSSKRSKIAYR
ncbi:hypothetical protein NMG60_11004368 [Bertholletia excelsa]